MIVYKYSLVKELKMIIQNYNNKKYLINKGVVFIDFNFWKFVKLYIYFKRGKLELPAVNISENVVCYIVSCGTWGAYELPNKIFICLNNLEDLQMSVDELIIHEIVHLRLENKLRGVSFEMKEKIVNEEVDNLRKMQHS